SPFRALPPRVTHEAIPKDISGRTSYLQALLAFHFDPQLIRAVFNQHRFGPPPPVTAASSWSGVDHFASVLRHATYRPIRTRFRYGSAPSTLNLATYQQLAGSLCKRHAVRPSVLRRHSPPTACKRTVSGSISLPSPGFFSPFPHGTGSLSVAGEYLALEG